MNRYLLGLIVIATLLTTACGQSGGSNSSSYTDGLTLGTGENISNFTLTGQATSFSLGATSGVIYFRFESSADFNGRFVRLYIYTTAGVPAGQKDITPPQATGHILLSAFNVTTAGNYNVKGYLVDSLGGETHVADSLMTLTP
jgi:hypothetical protein